MGFKTTTTTNYRDVTIAQGPHLAIWWVGMMPCMGPLSPVRIKRISPLQIIISDGVNANGIEVCAEKSLFQSQLPVTNT